MTAATTAGTAPLLHGWDSSSRRAPNVRKRPPAAMLGTATVAQVLHPIKGSPAVVGETQARAMSEVCPWGFDPVKSSGSPPSTGYSQPSRLQPPENPPERVSDPAASRCRSLGCGLPVRCHRPRIRRPVARKGPTSRSVVSRGRPPRWLALPGGRRAVQPLVLWSADPRRHYAGTLLGSASASSAVPAAVTEELGSTGPAPPFPAQGSSPAAVAGTSGEAPHSLEKEGDRQDQQLPSTRRSRIPTDP